MTKQKADYSVPKDILAMKPTGTCVKKLHNRYYVYSVKAVKRKDGRWGTKTVGLIGRIDPKLGYVARGAGVASKGQEIVEFGQYFLAEKASGKAKEALEASFSKEDAARILAMAIVDFAEGYTPIRDMGDAISQSHLGLEYRDQKFGPDALSGFLHDLGASRSAPLSLMRALAEGSGDLAVDGHSIPSGSMDNSLSDYGLKYPRFGDMQMNVLVAYDTTTFSPVYCDVFEGSSLDKASVKDMLADIPFKDRLFLADRGFYSADNKRLFTENGCSYIMPLSPNLVAHKGAVASIPSAEWGEFFLPIGKGGTVIKFFEAAPGKDGQGRVLVFRDEAERQSKCAGYLSELAKGTKGYAKEEYGRLKDLFGVIVLETSRAEDPEWVYRKYRQRWSIETFYDWLKNDAMIGALSQSDYYVLRGLSLVFLIEGMIQAGMRALLSKAPGISIAEAMRIARFLKADEKAGHWIVRNRKKKAMDLFAKIGVDVPGNLDGIVPHEN